MVDGRRWPLSLHPSACMLMSCLSGVSEVSEVC